MDTVTTPPTSGQVLSWNGTNWVPTTSTAVDEVWIGASDPIATSPTIELWYDTDASALLQSTSAGNAIGIVAIGSFPGTNPLIAANVATQITNNLAVTLLVGRRYRVYFAIRAGNAPSALGITMTLRDGSTVIPGASGPWSALPVTAGGLDNVTYEWLLDGDGLAKSLNVVLQGAGQFQIYNDGLSYFYVEDIGPNSSPALPVPDTPPAWIPVTFQNSWVNYDPAFAFAAYRKLGDMVQVRGLVKNGTIGQAIFTLPVGFRPLGGTLIFAADCANSAHARIDVQSTGGVVPASGSNGYFSLSTVSFSVTP